MHGADAWPGARQEQVLAAGQQHNEKDQHRRMSAVHDEVTGAPCPGGYASSTQALIEGQNSGGNGDPDGAVKPGDGGVPTTLF